MTKFVSLESFKEVGELCDKAVDAIVVNIETGKVMKVRWNACYVSTNTVPHLFYFIARKVRIYKFYFFAFLGKRRSLKDHGRHDMLTII